LDSVRYDNEGKKITKGGNHGIKFDENVQVFVVDNWKEYNVVVDGENNN
jgi:hypothetical protein